MKISILHYATPPIVGGVESTIYHHSRLLTQAGYQVNILSGKGEQFNQEIAVHLIPEIGSRNKSISEINQRLSRGEIPEEFINLRDMLYQELSKIIKTTQVLIVHNALTLHKNLALTAALKLIADEKNTNMVAWCHDFAWQDSLYTPDLHPGYPWELLRTPWPGVQYVTVSDHRRIRLAKLLNLPESNIELIPPGVDAYEFLGLSTFSRKLIEKLKLLEAEPLILLPARITRRKNIEFAIRVIALLKRDYPMTKLIVTGPPGPHNPQNIAYLNSLKSLRKELGVETNVEFLYEASDDDEVLIIPDNVISDFFRIADILLFPSKREGFGIPVLEAGLVRMPVFASDIAPVHESSADTAYLFDPAGAPDSVRDKIASFIESDRAYKLRRNVLSKFTWDSILKNKIIPLLDSFADKNGNNSSKT
jgi:glycosyltransferase involved in cell wall biosynthesis